MQKYFPPHLLEPPPTNTHSQVHIFRWLVLGTGMSWALVARDVEESSFCLNTFYAQLINGWNGHLINVSLNIVPYITFQDFDHLILRNRLHESRAQNTHFVEISIYWFVVSLFPFWQFSQYIKFRLGSLQIRIHVWLPIQPVLILET